MIYLLIFLCVLLSAFFSGAEMAFVSCSRVRLDHMLEEKDRKAQLVANFHEHPKEFLASVLIGNNLVNAAVVGMTAYVMEKQFSLHNEWIVTLITAPILIIFAETVPKDLFRIHADRLIYAIAPPLDVFYRFFRPMGKVILSAGDFLFRLCGLEEGGSPFVTREEFESLIDEGTRSGVLDVEERRLAGLILNFEKIQVKELMCPLEKTPMIEIHSCIADLKEFARKDEADHFLVYEELPSIIAGEIHVFDVLFETDNRKGLATYLQAPLFIKHDDSAERAFLIMQEKHQSFAVVLDESREVIGTIKIDALLSF